MPPLDTPYNPLNNPHNHFKCSIKFRNDLPEVPVDTKILVPPLHPEQLAAFKLTTLERELRQELQTLPGLGIPVTVLNTHNFSIPDTPQRLHEDDEALLAVCCCFWLLLVVVFVHMHWCVFHMHWCAVHMHCHALFRAWLSLCMHF